jgi:hypothetical protein
MLVLLGFVVFLMGVVRLVSHAGDASDQTHSLRFAAYEKAAAPPAPAIPLIAPAAAPSPVKGKFWFITRFGSRLWFGLVWFQAPHVCVDSSLIQVLGSAVFEVGCEALCLAIPVMSPAAVPSSHKR